MNTVIVYDSTFGNTEKIAREVAGALRGSGTVEVVAASMAGTAFDRPPDLLLVGGPTQRHGLSPHLRAVLDHVKRDELRGVRAATFDTRYRMSRFLTGSAAVDASHRLERAGCQLIAPPESFFVERDRPPSGEKRRHGLEHLEEGEVARARAWAQSLIHEPPG